MINKLIQTAIHAMDYSYSPYSKFKVGAALSTEKGAIHGGSNIENASYGLTMCAERVAIGAARMSGMEAIKRMAIVTDSPKLTAPCGACRQVIREFGPNAEIVLARRDGSYETYTMEDLLPNSFGPEDLGK